MAHIINQASKIIVRVHIPFLFNMLPTQTDFPHQILNQPIKKCEPITLHLKSRNTKMPSPAQPRSFKEAKNIFVKKIYLIKNLKTTFPQIPNPTSFFQFQLFNPSFFLSSSPSPVIADWSFFF
jgi:hypothetical protein